jgi:hypothetical protein
MPDVENDWQEAANAGVPGRFVDGTEVLRLTMFNAAAGVAGVLSGRMLVDGGRVVPFADPLVPTTARAASVFDKQLPRGWLLSAGVRLSAGSPIEGQTFAALSIGWGAGSQFTELELLTSGSVTAARKLGWPGGAILGPMDAAGALRSITGTNPAAGAEISETVPTGARWRLRGFTATLVSSAVAATRRVSLVVDDGANINIAVQATDAQITALTRLYSGPNAGSYVVAQTSTIGLPFSDRIELLAGARIRTITQNLDVGDDWSAPQLLVEERIEGA